MHSSDDADRRHAVLKRKESLKALQAARNRALKLGRVRRVGRPLRVTTDHHPAYRRAIRWILGRKVQHRTTRYLNNFMEQDHRAVKQRYYPMRGFGSFASAARFCSAFDELRQYFRWRRGRDDSMPLAEQRRLFAARWRSLLSEMAAA